MERVALLLKDIFMGLFVLIALIPLLVIATTCSVMAFASTESHHYLTKTMLWLIKHWERRKYSGESC